MLICLKSTSPLVYQTEHAKALAVSINAWRDWQVFASVPKVVQTELALHQAGFDRVYPNTARLFVFQFTASPNNRTAVTKFDAEHGWMIRPAGKNLNLLGVPCESTHDTLVVYFMHDHYGDETVVNPNPFIFIGNLPKHNRPAAYALIKAAVDEQVAATAMADLTDADIAQMSTTNEALKIMVQKLKAENEHLKGIALTAEKTAEKMIANKDQAIQMMTQALAALSN